MAHRSAQSCQTVGLGTKPAILPADEVLDEAVESGSTQTASTSAYDWWWKHQNTGVHFLTLVEHLEKQMHLQCTGLDQPRVSRTHGTCGLKLRVGEKTKRTNREDYCSPKKVQLSSKPPTSRLRKKRSRKFSRSYDAERSVRPAYPYM